MKTIVLTLAFAAILGIGSNAQQALQSSTIDSLKDFNRSYWEQMYSSVRTHTSVSEYHEFMTSHERQFILETFFSTSSNSSNLATAPNFPQQACTNIDFESGNLTGWVTSNGFHPLYNAAGCCANVGGAQFVTSGAGNDPCGGFPVVSPGGNFSLRLGNNGINGRADRIEQTFNVTAANANFTYKYAVVFQDPGHVVSEQPSFQIEMIDASGAQIPCTYYNVAAGQNITGFLNSPTCAGVVYKPWSNVSVDLTSYIGQNVTIRFTTYDCSLGGHYGYAYIDGSCLDFNINQNAILCQGSTIQLTAPAGFATYNWQLPNNTTQTTQTITTGIAGSYVLNMTTMTGCPGPTLNYLLVDYPKPVTNFTFNQANACNPNFSFTNLSQVISGTIVSYNWNLGDGNSSANVNPSHTYSGAGSYQVSLIATTNMGCTDTINLPISVYPNPIALFTANSVCQNNVTNFTNASSVSQGNITNYQWQFGDGNSSNQPQASYTYPQSGTYNVTLTVASDRGCVNSYTQSTQVFPNPVIAIASNTICQGQLTNFVNNSSIANGTITNFVWDFNNDGMPDNTSFSPSFAFVNSGNHPVSVTAISDYNCVNSQTITVRVNPNPVPLFTSLPVCFGTPVVFNNQSFISSGQIASYNWNFGNGISASGINQQHNYSTSGMFNVTLTTTSNFNCTSSITLPVVVFPKPVVNFASTSACLNQATQFANQSSVIAGAIINFKWDFDNNGTIDDTTANPIYVYPTAGNKQSKLVVTSNQNCVSQIIKPVVVHFNPVANFIAPSTCLPNTTNFINQSYSNDGLITSYQWDFNADNVIDNLNQNPQHIFTQTGNYGIKLEVQTEHGCINTITKSVYVNPTPTAHFTSQNNIGCPKLCVNFTSNSSIESGQIVTHQWLFGDNSQPNYQVNPTHCYPSGLYNVTLKVVSDSGCVATYLLPNAVTVYPEPIADFNITPNEVDITTPLIEVEDKSIGATSVYYLFSDGTSKNTRNFEHLFTTNVAKTVAILQVVSNQYTCKDSVVKQVVIKPDYVLYVPNAFTPNDDGLNDGFRAIGVGIIEFKLQIFDRWGALIFETNDINTPWDGSVNGKGDYESTKQEVYVWKAEVKDVRNETHDLMGHVTLLK